MLEFAARRGILLLASPPYTQKLNPVEGMIKVLVRMALAMLRHAGAPKKLVEFSLNHAILLLNRLPRSRKGRDAAVWLGLSPPCSSCPQGLGMCSVRFRIRAAEKI